MSHTPKPALRTLGIAQQISAVRLRTHVERLAGEIGERNVFRPEALRAAADYIQEEWRSQGYQMIPHWYEVSGGQWANLEVNRSGSQHYPPLFQFFYPRQGNFITFVSDFRSRGLMRRAVQAFRQASDFPLEHVATSRFVPGVAWSDHWSF